MERSWAKADTISARTGKDVNLVRWEQLTEAVESKVSWQEGVIRCAARACAWKHVTQQVQDGVGKLSLEGEER